jgi:hypothetical protein
MDLSQTSLLPCIYITSLLPSLRHTILLCRLEIQWHPQCTSDSSPCSPSWAQGSLNAQLILQSVITTPQPFSRTTMPLTNSLSTRPRCQHGGDWQLLGSKCRRQSSWHSYPGDYNGTKVDLLPFFSCGLASTNDGVNSAGVVQNFLDDGGAAPLMANIAANGTSSNQ